MWIRWARKKGLQSLLALQLLFAGVVGIQSTYSAIHETYHTAERQSGSESGALIRPDSSCDICSLSRAPTVAADTFLPEAPEPIVTGRAILPASSQFFEPLLSNADARAPPFFLQG